MKKILLLFISFILLASCTAKNDTSSGSTTNVAGNSGAIETSTPVVVEDTIPARTNDNPPSVGSGSHVIELFGDFQCPSCQLHNTALNPVLQELANNGTITLVYRQFPLSFHKNAFGDALAAMCAVDQNKYSEYKDALYTIEAKKSNAPMTNDERVKIASALGLDVELFRACLENKKYNDYVAADIALGEKYNVTGTPTYVLNGKIIDFTTLNIATADDLKNYLTSLENTEKTENSQQ